MTYAPLSLHHRTAVVIGGTSGIGKTLAKAMIQAGANVIATSRRQEEVDSTAEELAGLRANKAGSEASASDDNRARPASTRLTVDVTDRASVERLLRSCLEHNEAIDILINCAGRTNKQPSLDITDDGWNEVLDTNLTGTLRTCQVFGEHMISRGYGRIVNIASLASFVGLYQVAAYTASKAAVAGLTKALAVEWGKHGVCVNAIAPGVFRTPLNQDLLDGTDRGQEFKTRTPLGRFGQLEELAGAAIFLSSESASFVCGEVLVVDGGFLASGVNQ